MLGWIDTLLQGVLLGGLYSLYATGLSVIFGIMRLVNLAHGDLIVLGAFLILAPTTARRAADRRLRGRRAADVRRRLRAAIRAAQSGAWPQYSAAFADHVRTVDHRAERAARNVLRRHPPPQCRPAAERFAAAGRRHCDRRHAADLPRLRRSPSSCCSTAFSTAPRSAGRSAPRPTTSRSRSSWASTTVRSTR